MWALGHAISVATVVGFIALAGLAAEFGVVMQVYLNNALKRRLDAGEADNEETLRAAIRDGAVLRVRPKAMTVAVVMAGLLPILWGGGTGSEVISRIAAPMVGGMVTAPLLSMLVIPAAWYLLRRRRSRSVGEPIPLEQAAARSSAWRSVGRRIGDDHQVVVAGEVHHEVPGHGSISRSSALTSTPLTPPMWRGTQ